MNSRNNSLISVMVKCSLAWNITHWRDFYCPWKLSLKEMRRFRFQHDKRMKMKIATPYNEGHFFYIIWLLTCGNLHKQVNYENKVSFMDFFRIFLSVIFFFFLSYCNLWILLISPFVTVVWGLEFCSPLFHQHYWNLTGAVASPQT